MLKLDEVIKLLPHLKAHNVSKFKLGALEILLTSDSSDSMEKVKDVLTKQEEALPPDLRADSLMDQDKILNWSTQPDSEVDPLPLTGEGEL